MKEYIYTGKTIDEAWEKACKALDLPVDDRIYEILEMPKKGFLGFNSVPAKIKVELEDEEEIVIEPIKPVVEKKEAPKAEAPAKKKEKPAKPAKKEIPVVKEEVPADVPAEVKDEEPKVIETKPVEECSEKVQHAVAYLRDVLKEMGVSEFEISVEEKEDSAVIHLDGKSLGIIIGRRGETLDALQYLTGLVANKHDEKYFRLTLDSGNYREKREETLVALAKKISANVLRSGRSMMLEPMNPYERRVIHSTVSEIDGVYSKSVGEEPNRRVVINSNTPRKGNNRGGRGGNRGGRGGNRNYDRRRESNTNANTNYSKEDTQPKKAAQPVMDMQEKPLYSKIEL